MTTTSTATTTVNADGTGPVPVTVTRRGEGRPFLVLHGGASPQSVDGFARDFWPTSGPNQVLVPVHPGFGGTPRAAGHGQHAAPWPGCTRACSRSSA